MAALLKYTSNVPLWITAAITLIICLLYILRGGFKLSIITDKYQFSFIVVIILLSLFLVLGKLDLPSFEIIKQNSPNLIDKNYLPNNDVFCGVVDKCPKGCYVYNGKVHYGSSTNTGECNNQRICVQKNK